MCKDSPCNPTTSVKDDDQRDGLKEFFKEIEDRNTWTYREEPAAYFIPFKEFKADHWDAPHHNHSMHLVMWAEFEDEDELNNLAGLQGLFDRARPLEMRICTMMATQATPCGPLANNNFGGTLNGLYRVIRLAPRED
jgi:hypothetical protein